MASLETNKIAGAILGTLTFTLALAIVSEELFKPHMPEQLGYALPEPEGGAAGGGGAPAEAAQPIAALLASADPAKGTDISKRCVSCHSFEKGGPNKVGPNLYGVVGAKKAHLDGFGYSGAMKEAGGAWDFDSLSAFLENPKGYIKGTAMSFAGLKKPQERADMIAYLNQNSDSPLPLPEAPAEGAAPQGQAPGGQAPAQGTPAGQSQGGQQPQGSQSQGGQPQGTQAQPGQEGSGNQAPKEQPQGAQPGNPAQGPGEQPASGAAPGTPVQEVQPHASETPGANNPDSREPAQPPKTPAN
jgi:cytochrome c